MFIGVHNYIYSTLNVFEHYVYRCTQLHLFYYERFWALCLSVYTITSILLWTFLSIMFIGVHNTSILLCFEHYVYRCTKLHLFYSEHFWALCLSVYTITTIILWTFWALCLSVYTITTILLWTFLSIMFIGVHNYIYSNLNIFEHYVYRCTQLHLFYSERFWALCLSVYAITSILLWTFLTIMFIGVHNYNYSTLNVSEHHVYRCTQLHLFYSERFWALCLSVYTITTILLWTFSSIMFIGLHNYIYSTLNVFEHYVYRCTQLHLFYYERFRAVFLSVYTITTMKESLDSDNIKLNLVLLLY